MPYYTTSIEKMCNTCKTKRATVEVRGPGGSYGEFCKTCGERKKKFLNDAEQRRAE